MNIFERYSKIYAKPHYALVLFKDIVYREQRKCSLDIKLQDRTARFPRELRLQWQASFAAELISEEKRAEIIEEAKNSLKLQGYTIVQGD